MAAKGHSSRSAARSALASAACCACRSTRYARRLGAGTAAGFAAAYNTPFAAVLFVLESIAGIAAPTLLLPVMAAAVGATAAIPAGDDWRRAALRPTGIRLASTGEFVFVAGLGVAAAFTAMAFTGLLQRLERWVERHPLPQPLRAAVGGGLVGLAAVALPDVVGNGYETLKHLLDTHRPLARW